MNQDDITERLEWAAREVLKKEPRLLDRFILELKKPEAHALILYAQMATANYYAMPSLGTAGADSIHKTLGRIVAKWASEQRRPEPLPAVQLDAPETAEQRQARRWKSCIDAGLKMPVNSYARFPTGIGRIAEQEGVARQTFCDDLKDYLKRTTG